MSGALRGKVALVTGGSHGIGRATAERFARDGATVGIGYGHDEPAARETVERINTNGGRAFAVHTKLGTPGDATRFWDAFDEAGRDHVPDGQLDILVHNAAKGSFARLAALSEEEFDQVIAVNVRAPFFITKLALPRLRDGGRIINISSLAATVASPDLLAYGVSKAALNTFTLDLAVDLGPRGITVNSVAPGIVMTRNSQYLRDNAELAAQQAARVALGRLGEPDDVVSVIAFLASDEGRWVTGQVINASGGTSL
ncbi:MULTISPECIES: SDR family NAD(P)-dependent oxidoreductase [Catenuloplanes]|uniref:3-oxoacyl-[acyl-carrier protein] reductase n=1 Tax=Catenuloplanes niger TaxID=587534 RepID=A0AAE4CUH5_9ACTN|nr:SDR family oxidoreductase [Catenuloplanes niger]MDR7323413.1 3-oxoacyl-[acyl-carrier protein] reductase [Catenuloplanes niger]